LGIGIGLPAGHWVAGHSRTEIAETGRNDEPISAPGHRAGHVDALIKAPFSAPWTMSIGSPSPITHHSIFQSTEGLHCRAATDEARAFAFQVMRKDCVDADSANDENSENDQKDSAHECSQESILALHGIHDKRWTHALLGFAESPIDVSSTDKYTLILSSMSFHCSARISEIRNAVAAVTSTSARNINPSWLIAKT
jgi:hypothetical protein